MGFDTLAVTACSAVLAGVLALLASGSAPQPSEGGKPEPYYQVMPSAPAFTSQTAGVRKAVEVLRAGGWKGEEPAIVVDIAKQRLILYKEGKPWKAWWVSTSKNGVGSEPGSYKTPFGLHRIWKKSGETARLGQPLRGGEPTDRPISEEPGTRKVYISTRALMLDGLEPENKTSKSRGIWIHGTTAEDRIGKPASIGCVRMRNVDVVELFNSVPVGTLVMITDSP